MNDLPVEVDSMIRRTALTLARRLTSNIEFKDLIQEGRIAALLLLPKWDGETCTQVTFCKRRVAGAMIDYVRKASVFGPTRDMSRVRVISGDAPYINADGVDGITILDSIADEGPGPLGHAEHSSDCRHLASLLPRLTPVQRAVIEALYGEGVTEMELSKRRNVSFARINQCHKAALRNLRAMWDETEDLPYEQLSDEEVDALFEEPIPSVDVDSNLRSLVRGFNVDRLYMETV